MKVFTIQEPQTVEVPLLLSIPHSGTQFPLDIENNFDDRLRTYLDDTDWYVDRLYDFAPSLGITVIQANLSRWVVDLNRDAKNTPLYTDGRIITSCTPSTDFFGNELYKSKDLIPDEKEIEQRITDYYAPYHQKLQAIISAKKEKFGKVLLWDAHSIRHKVSTIQKAIFPDMILGDNDLTTAHPQLIETTMASLASGPYEIAHNTPFKGGHITRSFGKPEENVHALQLEMNKILYMDDNEIHYNSGRANTVKSLLETTLKNVIKTLNSI